MKERLLLPLSETAADNGSQGECLRPVKRLPGQGRRAQLIRVATAMFARKGLHGTTTQALAKAAGITEPVLYAHFNGKDELFRVAVERNIEARLRALDNGLVSLGTDGIPLEVIENLAKETLGVCLNHDTNLMLTNWALLEAPEYAADLYRNEIGAVELLWERELKRRVQRPRSILPVVLRVIPVAVTACLAHGFWLAILRHTPVTAKELACQFAADLARTAFTAALKQDDCMRQSAHTALHLPM